MVTREIRSGRLVRLWRDGLQRLLNLPFCINPDSLFVAYYASAEFGCFQALRWPMPDRILDLFAEFRCLTNGLGTTCGAGLFGALAHFGIDSIDVAEKEELRQLAMRGGHYTAGEQQQLIDYCQADVDALCKLLPAMLPTIDVPRALLRGRYMATAAKMEWNGVPIDTVALNELRTNWEGIKSRLTREIDRDYGVYIPAGEDSLDPQSKLGAAIYETAAEIGCHPFNLAAAVEDVYERYKQSYRPQLFAELAARTATGLTTRRIELWEDSGHDHST